MKKQVILTTEVLKEIKANLDNADWTFDFSGNEGDSEKACNYLRTQKFSIAYLRNYFTNYCDTSFVDELMEEGQDMVTSFIKESVSNLAEQRCNKFMWSGKLGTHGWDLETTCFQLNF